MKDLAFDEKTVRALASEQSFARGRDYVRGGAVSQLVCRGERLAAQVEGSAFQPYDVTVDLHDGGVMAMRCSCPYDWGGACKHVVAVLLKYLDAPEAVVQRPPLDAVLQALDRDTLVALLTRRAEEDTTFTIWIEAELAAGMSNAPSVGLRRTAVDPEPIQRQAEALLSGRNSREHDWSYDGFDIDEDAFAALIEKATPFLEAGDGRDALKILAPVMEVLVPAWLKQADWDETLHEFFPVLGQMIAEAVLLGDLLPEERDDLMVQLDVWQGMLDEYGLDEHLQVAIDALEQGWDEIGLEDVLAGKGRSWPLLGTSDLTGQQLTQARLRVLDIGGRTEEFLNLAQAARCHGEHTAMLVQLGRITDATDYARKKFRSTEDVLQLSRLLKETGQIDAALELATWGLSLKPEADSVFGAVGLARWLRDSAAAQGRDNVAVTAACAAFEQSLSREDFRSAERLAGPAWAELRDRLLTSLVAVDYTHDRTAIFLDEGMIDEAVRSVEVENTWRNPRSEVLLRLAEAAHASHSDWVIDIAESIATDIIDAGQSGSYELAAQWLEKAALAYDAAGRFEEWISRIYGLIEKHRRKYKLRPLLEALRPRA